MASKKSDDKATVSFSSDSDDDDSSSSSRLSSSASSEDDTDTETVTFAVPFPAPSQTSAAVGGSDEAATKDESKARAGTKKADLAVSPSEPRRSPVTEDKDKSPLRRTNDSEESVSRKDPSTAKEVPKSPGKQEETAGPLEVTKRSVKSGSSERARSPKITISDVDDKPPKQTKKNPEDDVTVTTSGKATNKIRAVSPKKADDGSDSLSSKSTKDGGRSVSPGKEGADEVDVTKQLTKRSSKLTAERTKSPKDAEEEPEIKSTDRAKSPKKTEGDKDIEKAKSLKKTLDENDSERAKSSRKTLDAKDTERAKSHKKTAAEDVCEEREKSPRTSANGAEEVKKKSSKDSSKTTPYELLRAVESPEKSPTRSIKSKKSLTTEDDRSPTPKRKSPLKDLKGKEQDEGETPDAAVEPPVKPKKASKKTGKSSSSEEQGANDEVDLSAAGRTKKGNDEGGIEAKVKEPTETKVKDPSDAANEVELLLKEIRQKRIYNQLASQPELESETTPGNKSIRVTMDEAGKTDDASKISTSEQNAGEVKDKDYMTVTGSSRNPADETAGTKSELENEESEFTYRRKSMDEFIKRILAEAKEERLKQKHGGASSNEGTEEERKAGAERYAERNGEITENGVDGTKWRNGSSGAEDKEGSMLDRRLAKIEKRRFGGTADAAGKGEGGVEAGRGTKVAKETEEDGTTKSTKDAKDYDVNLDEDLEEINRFLQSRKTAASRFDFDEPGLNDDATTATPTKRRWATGKEQQQQPEEEDLQSPGSRSQTKKKYGTDLDFNDDDERFLGRFKRERDSALPEESFSPKRRNETNEIIRERTRNVRVLIDQQVEIVQSMRSTSKSLDELEKEIREVRQVCVNRQARIEALEGALGAEYRAFENDSLAATDRQKSTEALAGAGAGYKEDFGLAGFGRLRRQDKFKSESLDEENFPFRRRSGSVASTTSYTSGFDGRGRPGEGSNDGGLDSRPPSGLKQRDQMRVSESESGFTSGLDRRRGGSAARDRPSDAAFSFGPDDVLLGQRPARSRASIATSNPAVDYAGSISGDSFLAKIRAKYAFLAPTIDSSQGYSSSIRGGQGSNSLSSSSYASPSSLTSDSRYGKRFGSRDILSSSSAYSSLGSGIGGYGGGRYSISDTRGSSYGASGGGGGFFSTSSISSSSYGDSGRMRRAQSVSEVSYDRSASSPTNLGSSGGEFHSRFLDKVRGKKAMGDDVGPSVAPTKGQEKPFKSRFLKTTTSFDAGASRSERLTNGFDDGGDGEEPHRRHEVNGNA